MRLRLPSQPVLWFTGLSGAGKSTLAGWVEQCLLQAGRPCCVLDGDALRQGLNRDLGFSPADRRENIRRVAEVARLMADAGLVVAVALISPLRADRAMARSRFAPGQFIEVHVDTPLAVAEQRDVKGLYRCARQGLLRDFTGLDAPYEVPEAPELRIDTLQLGPGAAARHILARLGVVVAAPDA